MAQIGDRHSDGRIYAGPDYGYQSPATYKQLEKKGAFKLGSSAIRRTKQAIGNRLPQQVKDFAKWYGESDQRADQRLLDRGYTQKDLDKRDAFKSRVQGEGPDATQKLLSQVSDATNIAPEIVQGVTALAETAITGRLGKSMAKQTLQGVSRAPAPVAHAMGPDHKARLREKAKKFIEEQKKAPKQSRAVERAEDTKWIRNKDGSYTLQSREDINAVTAKGVKPKDRKWPQLEPTKNDYGFERDHLGMIKTDEHGNQVRRVSQIGNNPVGGSTRKTPKSQAQYNEPKGTRTRRAEPKDTTPPETFLDIEDVKTSDMARPKSDGKSLDAPIDLRRSGLVDREGKPMPSHSQIRQERLSKERAKAVDAKISARTKELNTEEIRQQVWWADGDRTKLEPIAADLGIEASKHKTFSALERAITKRLDKTDVVYGGKPTLTQAERTAVERKFDRQNLTGATETEVQKLHAAANGPDAPIKRRLKDMGPQMPEADRTNYRDTQGRGKRSYGTREPKPDQSIDYDLKDKLETRTAKNDHQWYKDRYEFDESTGQFLLDDNGAYIPKKVKKGVKITEGTKPRSAARPEDSVVDLIKKRLGY